MKQNHPTNSRIKLTNLWIIWHNTLARDEWIHSFFSSCAYETLLCAPKHFEMWDTLNSNTFGTPYLTNYNMPTSIISPTNITMHKLKMIFHQYFSSSDQPYQQIFEGQCFITTSHARIVLFFFLDHLTPTALWEPCSIFSNLKYAIWRPFAYEDVKECHLFLMHKSETLGAKDMEWSDVLLGTCFVGGGGTIGNPLRTLLRTWWERIWN
jgi:hypothetical protein